MSRGQPVGLGTRAFTTKQAEKAFFKDMLARCPVGSHVNQDDHLDLAALLERHDEYKEKVGVGVDHFTTMMTEHGTKCFRIVRKDGSGTDFSYLHAVNGRPPSRKQEVSQAFRHAVRMDLYAARDRFFRERRDGEVTCAVTSERLDREQAHMDHRPPMTFGVIVTTFLESRGMSLDEVPISAAQDEQVAPEINDDKLRDAFRSYHQRVAQLDIVNRTVNLAQSSRNRLKAGRISL